MSSPPLTDDRFLALFEASRDAMFVVTQAGRVLACNRAATEMLGYSREQLLGLRRDDLVDANDPRMRAALDERDRIGSFRTELTLRRQDGSRFEVETTSVQGGTLDDGEPWSWLVIRDLSDRIRAEQALAQMRDANELLRALSDSAFEAVFMHWDGVIHMANRAAETYAGVEPGGLIGKGSLDFIAPQSVPLVMAKIAASDDQPYEAYALRSDGSIYPMEVRVRTVPIQLSGGAVRVVAVRDMTARRQLEEQLREAQKMEALGRLAGGVAHDFNNLLAVILGATELALLELPDDHPSRVELRDVVHTAERAADLTRQLLAFGRKSVMQPKIVDVSEILDGMRAILRRLVGDKITLQIALPSTAAPVRVDPVHVSQVVLNLVVNARDAMTEGGQLRIDVELVDADAEFCRQHIEVQPGPHVALRIADTGMGMSPEIAARIFEPFFTTKGPRRGTGLGLATVFGIVKQSGGTIWVDSQLGRGTTFTIFLPMSDAVAKSAPDDANAAAPG
jgi:two-component system cell cycle sensor histidine kinase/response regulator CckA